MRPYLEGLTSGRAPRVYEKPRGELEAREFKTAVVHALRTLFGTCGAATEVDCTLPQLARLDGPPVQC